MGELAEDSDILTPVQYSERISARAKLDFKRISDSAESYIIKTTPSNAIAIHLALAAVGNDDLFAGFPTLRPKGLHLLHHLHSLNHLFKGLVTPDPRETRLNQPARRPRASHLTTESWRCKGRIETHWCWVQH